MIFRGVSSTNNFGHVLIAFSVGLVAIDSLAGVASSHPPACGCSLLIDCAQKADFTLCSTCCKNAENCSSEEDIDFCLLCCELHYPVM